MVQTIPDPLPIAEPDTLVVRLAMLIEFTKQASDALEQKSNVLTTLILFLHMPAH